MVVWLRFIVWIQVFGGFLGATGQTGLLVREQLWPVRPVLCTGQNGTGRSVLQFSRFASDLFRGFARSFEAFCVGLIFPYLFQTLAKTFEALGDFRDIGRRFEFRRNFDRLPFTPLWSPASVLQRSLILVSRFFLVTIIKIINVLLFGIDECNTHVSSSMNTSITYTWHNNNNYF